MSFQKLGAHGTNCDVYVTGSNGKYDVSHHLTPAEMRQASKPPQNQTNGRSETPTKPNK